MGIENSVKTNQRQPYPGLHYGPKPPLILWLIRVEPVQVTTAIVVLDVPHSWRLQLISSVCSKYLSSSEIKKHNDNLILISKESDGWTIAFALVIPLQNVRIHMRCKTCWSRYGFSKVCTSGFLAIMRTVFLYETFTLFCWNNVWKRWNIFTNYTLHSSRLFKTEKGLLFYFWLLCLV